MPPQAHEHQPRMFSTGDVVWVHIKGLPWWPGQVMDQSRATAKMREHKRLHTKLINTFGDNQYCWAFPHDIAMFEEKVSTLSQQRITTQSLRGTFKVALEEATQLLDVRDGRTPTTNHVVLDFLKPLPQVPATLPAQLAERSAYVPPNALCTNGQPEDMAVNVQNALHFLRQLALHPDRGVDNSDVLPRFLHTWRCHRYSMPEEFQGVRKRKRTERQESATPQLETRPTPKGLKKVTSTPQAAIEEEVKDGSSESEEEISDAENVDEPEQVDGSSEDEEEEMVADEPVTKKQRRQLRSPNITLTDENQWLALTLGNPAQFLQSYRGLASSRSADLSLSRPAQASAFLYREQIFSRSVLQQEGKLGELASQATKAYLQQREAAKRGGKRGKEAAGIPVPKPVIGMSAVARAYADRIPAESAEFNKMLDAFYSRHGKTVSPPIVDGVLLNLEVVFRAVASRGGNEAVTLNKQWPAIGREWRGDVSRAGMCLMRKKYNQHLLAFELDISKDAAESTVYPTSKATGKDKAALRAARVAKAVKEIPMKRPKISKKIDKAKAASSAARKKEPAQPARKQLAEADPFANLESSEDDEPYMRRQRKNAAPKDLPLSEQRRQAKILKGNLTKKSELNQDSFTSLLLDDNQKPKEKKKAAIARPALRDAVVKPSKSSTDQKIVIRIKFAQGVELPSRQRLSKEMRQFGHIEDTQLLSKQNTYTFRFSSEQSASRAFGVLERKAAFLLRLPKDSIKVYQEQPIVYKPRPKPDPSQGARPFQASTSLPAQAAPSAQSAQAGHQRPPASSAASSSISNTAKQPLKGIMKRARENAQPSVAPHDAAPASGIDPRQLAGIPRGVHPSAPRPLPPTSARPARMQGPGEGMALRPPLDPRQGSSQLPRPPDPWQAARPLGPPAQMQTAGPADPRQQQQQQPPMNQQPPLQGFPPLMTHQQHRPMPNFHPPPVPPHPAGNAMVHDPRQMYRPDLMHARPSMPMPAGHPLQHHMGPPQGMQMPQPHRPIGRPFPTQAPNQGPPPQQHQPPGPVPGSASNKDAAAELSMKMVQMDQKSLMSILQSVNVNLNVPSQLAQSSPASQQGPHQQLGGVAGPQNRDPHLGEGPSRPAAQGTGVQGNGEPNTDISGQLMALMNVLGNAQ